MLNARLATIFNKIEKLKIIIKRFTKKGGKGGNSDNPKN